MRIFRNSVAAGAVVAFVACGLIAFAQDDLDDLLADLEADAPAAAAEGEKAEAADEEAAEAPAAEEAPVAEEEVAEEAKAEEPAAEEAPAVEEPAAEAEVAEEPAAEEAAAEEPAAEEPVAEAEVAEEPAAEEAAAEEPAAEEEVAEEAPAAEEPAVEAEVAEEPAAEEAAAEEPAAEEEVAEEAPAAEEPVAEAEVAEEPAAEEAAAEEPVAEVAEEAPAEEKSESEDLDSLLEEAEAVVEDAPVAEEPVVEVAEEAPAVEDATEEAPVEVAESAEPAPVPAADDDNVSSEKVDEVLGLLSELAAEVEGEEAAEADPADETTTAVAGGAAEPAEEEEKPVVNVGNKKKSTESVFTGKDSELLENIRQTEKLRREAMDAQALREIREARDDMAVGEYTESVRHYGIALKLMNDRPASKPLKRECRQGMAEGLFRAALEEDRTGRRERAIKYIEKAIELRHPKARKQLEAWLTEEDPDKNKTDVSEITHRRNEKDYQDRRKREQQHLKRSRQLLAQRELDRALDECELVLVTDPYNQEAMRLRDSIQRKREVILKQEHAVTRESMIADVEAAWRPVYAVDARELEKTQSQTVKKALGEDPERSMEQDIIKRMKEMRLPSISFKPPATIIDAVEYFRGASRDFDRPEIPLEQRGFNFVLKPPSQIRMAAQAAAEVETNDFSDDGSEEENSGTMVGVPVIPMITASDITFYDALKLVCESVDYKFVVQGPIVMVMQKDMSTDELVTRSFPVLSTFLEKMGGASEDMKSMQSSGFSGAKKSGDDDGEENQERDWKEFFSLLGVKWPEGSSIFYVKTVGRLFVKNTLDNLAEFENVLLSLNQQVTLVEIETRFVEVCQDDLNSLGFEWILNDNLAVGINRTLGKALGLRPGMFSAGGTATVSTTTEGSSTRFGTNVSGGGGTDNQSGISSAGSTSVQTDVSPSGWVRNRTGSQETNFGISKMDGENFATRNRYLSTLSNHISGKDQSTNDQFMRVNAFLGTADLSMILHMLSQRSDTDLLSAPKVLTRPGEEAVMKVVTEYIYPTDYDVQLQSSSSGGGGYGGGSSQSAILAVVEPQSFTMREVGVILQVTPTLTDDGNVVDLELNTQVVDEPTWKNYGMKIPFTGNSSMQNFQGIGDIFTGVSDIFNSLNMTIENATKQLFAQSALESATMAMENLSNSDSITYYDAPMEQPFFHVRSIDSKVSVYPGATIVMGGLITEQRKAMDDKIPILGDIPFIGRLFRSHSEQTSKRNLLIFVTTRIVDGRGREMRNDGFELAEQKEAKAAPEPEDIAK